MEENDLLDCSNPDNKNKGSEFVCRIARHMQEKDLNVSFSEIEDAMTNVISLDKQIKDIDDLKSVLKPSLAKNEKAERVFPEAFDKALKETFTATKKKAKEEDIEKEL